MQILDFTSHLDEQQAQMMNENALLCENMQQQSKASHRIALIMFLCSKSAGDTVVAAMLLLANIVLMGAQKYIYIFFQKCKQYPKLNLPVIYTSAVREGLACNVTIATFKDTEEHN